MEAGGRRRRALIAPSCQDTHLGGCRANPVGVVGDCRRAAGLVDPLAMPTNRPGEYRARFMRRILSSSERLPLELDGFFHSPPPT